MTNLLDDLAEVLGLSEEATQGNWYYVHGHGWCCKGGPKNAPYALPLIRDAKTYDGPPSYDESFLRSAVNFIRKHAAEIERNAMDAEKWRAARDNTSDGLRIIQWNHKACEELQVLFPSPTLCDQYAEEAISKDATHG